MGTIIAVHGTGATGPAEGDRWWQRGSDFERHLRSLVAARNGDLKFEPLIWDGENSEASRYEAGRELKERIVGLEERGEDYCLIGHSHGGSVICHCLMLAHYEGRHLPHLRQWISIGTPFIETRINWLLFSKLDYLGGAAYFIFAYLLIAYVAFLISIVRVGADNPTADVVFVVAGAVFLLLVYFGLHLFQPRKLKIFRRSRAAELQAAFGKRWLALWHEDDEAIQGLRLVRDVRLSPFHRYFAVPAFSFLALLSLPILMYIMSEHARVADYSLLAGNIAAWSDFKPTLEDSIDGFERFARNSLAVIAYPSQYLFKALALFDVKRTGGAWFDHFVLGAVLFAGAVLGFLALWFVGLAFRLLVVVFGRLCSRGLSWTLNLATQIQLKRLSLGSDTTGEVAVAASPRPPWIATQNAALPAALSGEISQSADAAAAQAVGKLRAALSSLAFSEKRSSVGDMIGEYLTWRELIHTSYFDVPRFRKLIGYAISQLVGFAPTAAFRADPDHALVAGWYEDLMKPALRP